MQRTVVLPADVGEVGLAELKQWLGISRNTEDALLAALLKAALELCEAFTGQAPLAQMVEEQVAPQRGLQLLVSRPVREIVDVEVTNIDGTRATLPPLDYTADIALCGTANFRLLAPIQGRALTVRLIAGIAGEWATLPPALRQGIVRLAAHYYRERDADGQRHATPPPLSVTALWQPWRLMRLA
ncbi:MAG: head-tail connector protein [Erythrobacter sp.]